MVKTPSYLGISGYNYGNDGEINVMFRRAIHSTVLFCREFYYDYDRYASWLKTRKTT
jgi:hypothetical protein